MSSKTTQWYTSWFNTPYYHMLYQDRDHSEARAFMDLLTKHLNLSTDSHILDLACGRGRHSIYLNHLGFKVTGVDLSEESIAYAKQFENDRLHFEIHDMCKPYRQKFDAVFNLFTSFGYFDNEEDNLNTIRAIRADLKHNGVGVIDFMNTSHVIENLVSEDSKVVSNIHFKMTRRYEDGYIFKDIRFEDEGREFEFTERVKGFTLADFERLYDQAEVELIEVFGNYSLNDYDEQTSERLIMIFQGR